MKPQLQNIILSVSFLFGILSCSNPVANSLLVDYSSTCDPIANSSCADGDSSGSAAAVEISPANPNLAVNLDQGDLVEITGTCKDQGRKKNRIIKAGTFYLRAFPYSEGNAR